MKLRLACCLLAGLMVHSIARAQSGAYLSPDAIFASPDGHTVFVGCATSNVLLWIDTTEKKVIHSLPTPAPASGLALSPDGSRLYVTCAAPESSVLVVDTHQPRIIANIAAGHTARSPVLSPDNHTLYVCNQFDNDVSVVDLPTGQETGRILVQREPMAADITPDGKYLLVANHLSSGASDGKSVAAVISVIDLVTRRTVKELALPIGSEMLKDLRVSPDGKYAAVTHIFCNYDLPTRRVELGLINANALTLIRLANLEPLCTFLLDEPDRGAGNPWGVAWSPDSTTLAIAHAGTREVSVIDFPALLAGLPGSAKRAFPTNESTAVLKFVPHYEDEELNDGLPFLVGARERIQLAAADLGARALAFSGHTLYTANYFSDNLSVVDLSASRHSAVSLALGPVPAMTPARKGEYYFHDAEICRQGWQSCSSCHPGDGRTDALNWDLASEGPGHPKNTKSILLACKTEALEPSDDRAAAMGPDTRAAIDAAIQSLLFTNEPGEVTADMLAYINSLTPVPSPNLTHGRLSASALRGQTLFSDAGCVHCHIPGIFSDRRLHDVGTATRFDTAPQFRTPSLIEAWRTAPYLHDGSAATVRDVLTTCNPRDGTHGDVSNLSDREIDDLCAYVMSL